MVGLVRWGEADLFKERHGVHKQVDAASKTCGRRKATRSTWKWRRAASRHDEEKISRRAFPSGHHPQSEHYTEIIARHTHESTQQLMQHLSHTLASQKIRPVLSTINYCVCVCDHVLANCWRRLEAQNLEQSTHCDQFQIFELCQLISSQL